MDPAPIDASRFYTENVDSYLRFIRLMGYPRGLRAAFLKSPAVGPDMRILDAGCGTGTTSLALRAAIEARGLPIEAMDAFDLTPAMLDRFRATLDRLEIKDVRLVQADVLKLETLPEAWKDYDLVVSTSMLEYIPRSSFPDALRGLRQRLRAGGTFLLFITRDNFLMRPMIGRAWSANLYSQEELVAALAQAGFGDITFDRFPLPHRHLDIWGHIVRART